MRVTPTATHRRAKTAGSRVAGRMLSVALALAGAGRAEAYYLDKNGNFDLRGVLYTESAVATEASEHQTMPSRRPFQVIEHRTFFNPELEGKLTSYQPFRLDDLSFRFTLWGFYDGIYDYLTSQYDRSRLGLRARFSEGHTETGAAGHTDQVRDLRKVYTYQPDPVLGSNNDQGDVADLPFRINEAYFNIAKGPLFMRIGRQAISWGESDTIALLDQMNPFNLTLGLPGIFQDIDEARIPLWTWRTNYKLFESLGPLSGGYVDSYLVPGSIDTTVSQVPVPLASPYSPPTIDPQAFIDKFTAFIPPDVRNSVIKAALGGLQFVQYDQLPTRSMSNSRYGVRLGALVARDYTTSLWFYRTLAQNPIAVFRPLDIARAPLVKPGGQGPTQIITATTHGLVSVFGGGLSFFSAPLDGIVRTEVEYFLDEPNFIPNVNIPFENLARSPALRKFLVPLGAKIKPGPIGGFIPRADSFRWEIGFDRFFFYRPINPSSSIVWVSALVGDWNLSETFTHNDFRYFGQQKTSATGLKVGANTQDLKGIPDVGKLHTVATDFVDKKPVEWFVQSTMQTDLMHGKLEPRFTAVINPRGTYAFPMTVTYRYTDNLLFQLRYTLLEGGFFQTGFFRDRDQVALRMTLLLN